MNIILDEFMIKIISFIAKIIFVVSIVFIITGIWLIFIKQSPIFVFLVGFSWLFVSLRYIKNAESMKPNENFLVSSVFVNEIILSLCVGFCIVFCEIGDFSSILKYAFPILILIFVEIFARYKLKQNQ
ncbi:MAG: hypothetical protein LBP36_04145 [Oscillospiraceae bacterium]|jgi:hypothetical protein|nr:hypothetical protein [Oscillospiraceae bacterium]